MSGFQDQLDKEITKRGLERTEGSTQHQNPITKIFSSISFLKGLFFAGLVLFCIVSWAWYKKSETVVQIEEKLPSKTAIVERDSAEIYRLSEDQPVLRMPEVDYTVEEKPEADKSEITASEKNKIEQPKPSSAKTSLAAAPIKGLYESSTSGIIPVVRQSDQLTPFEGYKKPFQKIGNKPLLSIVLYNVGLSKQKTESLLENLPDAITFSLSPYSQNLKLLVDATRQSGHEVWLTLPLETKNYPADDPGPSTLLVNASVEQNQSRLLDILASVSGYAGFVSQKDHVFKREDANVNPSIEEIFKRGLAMLDSNPSLYSFVGDIASKNNYPHAKNNFWLDENLNPLVLNQKIRQLIEYGNSGGNVVLMLRPYPASIKALQKFLNSAAADAFELAPLSAQVQYGE